MWLMIILKVTKRQAFTLSSEDTTKVGEKPQRWGSNWLTTPTLPNSLVVLGLRNLKTYFNCCNSFVLSWVEKFKPGTQSSVSITKNVPAPAEATKATCWES